MRQKNKQNNIMNLIYVVIMKKIKVNLEDSVTEFYTDWIKIAQKDFNLTEDDARFNIFEFYKQYHKQHNNKYFEDKQKYYNNFIKQFELYVFEHRVGIRKWKKNMTDKLEDKTKNIFKEDVSEFCCGKLAELESTIKDYICKYDNLKCKYKTKYYTSKIGYHFSCDFYKK